ncbi:metallophosphoesterase [Candidatus Aerophobetes bacterium]|nr:metallophosphoesterase [Candidatus Aerophobetes bacterium]
MASGSVFKLPTGEYRFTGENISINSGKEVYIDPSIWCIHGEYETFEKHILTKSNVTAHLAQIHPFTLGWIADLHIPSSMTEVAIRQIDRLALCNPTLTIIGGDIVFGPREEYVQAFEKVWDYVKSRLSNNLWLKGNHDVSADFSYYYDWFERIWILRLGNFKFIGFDTYNEQNIIPESCWPGLSLPDVIWLKKKLTEDELNKVILAHHPLNQWSQYAPLAFKEGLNIKYVLSGHDPKVMQGKIRDTVMYVNGTCTRGVEWQVATINTFMKDGTSRSILIDDEIIVADDSDTIKITTPRAMSWEKKTIKAKIPIRLVKFIQGHCLNFIMFCPSQSTKHIQITEKKNQNIEVASDVETYIIGKEVYSKDAPYDFWRCSCGKIWNSYYANVGKSLKIEFKN